MVCSLVRIRFLLSVPVVFAAAFSFVAPASATLLSVTGPLSQRGGLAAIIDAPDDIRNNGAGGLGQMGFDEVQNYLLQQDIRVDGGTIAAGTVVSSHMIFLNNPTRAITANEHLGVQWTLDDDIIGVMSSMNGGMEFATSPFLGAAGTVYPISPFGERGLEAADFDSYFVLGNVITVNMHIQQPGDWIRVVTGAHCAPVPEPASCAMLAMGAFGLVSRRSRRGTA